MPRFRPEILVSGQPTILDQEQGVNYFHLREPFLMARREFNWEENAPAIGINAQTIRYIASKNRKIRVFVGPQDQKVVCYEADPSHWIDWTFLHQSSFFPQGKNKIELLELPWTNLHFKTITKESDSTILEAWMRLEHYEQTGQQITAPIAGESNNES